MNVILNVITVLSRLSVMLTTTDLLAAFVAKESDKAKSSFSKLYDLRNRFSPSSIMASNLA